MKDASYNYYVLSALDDLKCKETEEDHWKKRQIDDARAEFEENISKWAADQKRRRSRYLQRYGPVRTLHYANHIPFKKWLYYQNRPK